MDAATQQVDDESRVVLPPAFAGRTVVVESVSATEVRVRTVRRRKRMSFAELMARMDETNQNEVIDFGPPVGEEAL